MLYAALSASPTDELKSSNTLSGRISALQNPTPNGRLVQQQVLFCLSDEMK